MDEHTQLQRCRELEFLKFFPRILCETSYAKDLCVRFKRYDTLSCTCLDTENRLHHFSFCHLSKSARAMFNYTLWIWIMIIIWIYSTEISSKCMYYVFKKLKLMCIYHKRIFLNVCMYESFLNILRYITFFLNIIHNTIGI